MVQFHRKQPPPDMVKLSQDGGVVVMPPQATG
jgi:hypothetical protein